MRVFLNFSMPQCLSKKTDTDRTKCLEIGIFRQFRGLILFWQNAPAAMVGIACICSKPAIIFAQPRFG